MQLNIYPAVYDVIVKTTVKMKKITYSSWMENVQIILNTESTLCLLFLYVYMLLFIICYLYVLKLY